jgi:hypothetical protein
MATDNPTARITTAQAALILNLSVMRVYQLVRCGDLAADRSLKAWTLDPKDVYYYKEHRIRHCGAACSNCGVPIRKDIQNGLCRPCATVCHCGKPKDYRAAECLSCGMSRKALAQWADPQSRAVIQAAIIDAGVERRLRYEDIRIDSNWQQRPSDGRWFIYYWGDDNKHHCIYRYQWVWEQSHGPIPEGVDIHHKDEIPWHDDLDNLEALPSHHHAKLHGALARARAAQYICPKCKVQFRARGLRNGRTRYCSKKCWYTRNR